MEVSYRQVGKHADGVLRKGHIAGQTPGGKPFSTIPAKFETTLFTGNKEQDGFGSRSHRFLESENDLPGPGSYSDETLRIKDIKIYSKKGLGVGFVSRTKRQAAFGPNSNTPGPGNYENRMTFQQSVAEFGRFNQTGSTHAFKAPSKRSVTVAEEPLPGPGQYQVQRHFDPSMHRQGGQPDGTVAFRSQSGRYNSASRVHQACPAPGQYNPTFPASSDRASQAAFRSTVPIAGRAQVQRMSKEQELGVVPRREAASAAPGPGEYNYGTTSFKLSQRQSPQFISSTMDRFGRAPQGLFRRQTEANDLPGPGSYHQEQLRETALISSAVFMSSTARRGDERGSPVPGPAYYSPLRTEARKSYHLNAVHRWMPS
mmetsp:Transcript_30765/g.76806  ORF Transcript_30765/g.76806 Transcript_30765/m.76806 type:complete len:371 (+) Transcript_30765:54-1166(+)